MISSIGHLGIQRDPEATCYPLGAIASFSVEACRIFLIIDMFWELLFYRTMQNATVNWDNCIIGTFFEKMSSYMPSTVSGVEDHVT